MDLKGLVSLEKGREVLHIYSYPNSEPKKSVFYSNTLYIKCVNILRHHRRNVGKF